MLPIGTFAETSGTYVNLEGMWQSYAGAAAPLGEARPGWKVLRVLGNLLDLTASSTSRRKTCAKSCAASAARRSAGSYDGQPSRERRVARRAARRPQHVPVDALVRRAPSLQKTREGRTPPATY